MSERTYAETARPSLLYHSPPATQQSAPPVAPILVDRTYAPHWLRYTLTGRFPTLAEQSALREREIAAGTLTAETRGLMDIRQATAMPHLPDLTIMAECARREGGWPRRRAYLVRGATQFGVARQMRALAPETMQVGIFTDEFEALKWLLSDTSTESAD